MIPSHERTNIAFTMSSLSLIDVSLIRENYKLRILAHSLYENLFINIKENEYDTKSNIINNLLICMYTTGAT